MNYSNFLEKINRVKNLKIEVIGRSWDDRDIFSVSTFFDEKKPWFVIQGAIHAREHLSTDFIMWLIGVIDDNYHYFKNLSDFPNICFVPMVNPDGVEIVHYGENAIRDKELKCIMKNILKSVDHRLIKCNARGVDINNNFDAGWEMHSGADKPYFYGFKGEYKNSERETQVLVSLTQRIRPIFTISYHLKGEEIYYDFHQHGKVRERDYKIANIISKTNGYKIVSVENSSFGGFKDWCVKVFKIPAVTIELGRDELSHPVPSSELNNILQKNASILHVFCDIVKIWKKYNEMI